MAPTPGHQNSKDIGDGERPDQRPDKAGLVGGAAAAGCIPSRTKARENAMPELPGMPKYKVGSKARLPWNYCGLRRDDAFDGALAEAFRRFDDCTGGRSKT